MSAVPFSMSRGADIDMRSSELVSPRCTALSATVMTKRRHGGHSRSSAFGVNLLACTVCQSAALLPPQAWQTQNADLLRADGVRNDAAQSSHSVAHTTIWQSLEPEKGSARMRGSRYLA